MNSNLLVLAAMASLIGIVLFKTSKSDSKIKNPEQEIQPEQKIDQQEKK